MNIYEIIPNLFITNTKYTGYTIKYILYLDCHYDNNNNNNSQSLFLHSYNNYIGFLINDAVAFIEQYINNKILIISDSLAVPIVIGFLCKKFKIPIMDAFNLIKKVKDDIYYDNLYIDQIEVWVNKKIK